MIKDEVEDPQARDYQHLIGKTIDQVVQNEVADEGISLVFTDGTFIDFGWAGCEGYVREGDMNYQRTGEEPV